VGILVHQETDSVRAAVERKGNVSVQSVHHLNLFQEPRGERKLAHMKPAPPVTMMFLGV
jgi:hypothetical protein